MSTRKNKPLPDTNPLITIRKQEWDDLVARRDYLEVRNKADANAISVLQQNIRVKVLDIGRATTDATSASECLRKIGQESQQRTAQIAIETKVTQLRQAISRIDAAASELLR